MASSRQIEQTAAEWLARREGDHWDRVQQVRLDAWLEQSIAHRVAFLRLEAAWQESGRLAALGAGQAMGTAPVRGQWAASPLDRRAAARTAQEPEAAQTRPPDVAHLVFARRPDRERGGAGWPRPLAAAFATALMASLALCWQWWSQVEQTSYLTAVGDLRDVALSDGSQATLSSDSRITVSLSRDERHVDLQRGEGFFQVAKDPGRPFAVAVGPRRVVAVGTRFAVRRDGEAVRVVVTEGVVRLESQPDANGRAQPTTLLPAGSIATVDGSGVFVRTGSVADAERLVDWRSGYLAFHDTSLAEAANEFNRYNRRKIVMGDAAVGALRVGGNFRWSNTDVFVRLLEQGFPVRVEREEDRVVLHSQ
ncbi:FecR family protein [Pseudoxanthomonas indica]|uniref:FecR family protein n=1 Tax=Pseudoxanthomonas indica TaxID=428993 RepID=A0A1T5KGG8_9GAMM|nr:FecR domain-containing protein [Pseudoxanthomonas indica]GGD49245.1 iron dicitrate transporter FecR [Pseudoxanthomonas indica]SKC62773.1 FecR family protein [Pseudoxanthomonas indica]